MKEVNMKKVKIEEIIRFLSEDVQRIEGKYENLWINKIASYCNAKKNSLDWINHTKNNKQIIAESSNAKVLIVDDSVKYTELLKDQNKVLIYVENPRRIVAKIGNEFFVKKLEKSIHFSVIIDSKATIGQDVYLGPNVIIGDSIIGDNVIIYGNVTIYDCVEIGNNVVINSGTVLGADGFGYEREENNGLVKFPQIGRLIIKDNVEIGANSCIDRGALEDTIIGEGTKINNLCHIAHNVKIGKNVLITGQINISGSCIIEDDVLISPNATIRDHIYIGKGAHIGMGSVVTKNVPAGETWIGNPAKFYKKKK
jgi:UDP-3-O-[3-hydroxymyristoyl] glucosamine N-acyltransferase